MVKTRNNKQQEQQEQQEEMKEVFHDSREEEFDELGDSFKMDILINHLRIFKSDVLSKMDSIKEDIIIQFRNENLALKEQITKLANDLEEKDVALYDLKCQLNEVKIDYVPKCQFVEVERDTAESQQYLRRNNVEISNLPESISQQELEEKVIEIGKATDVNFDSNDIQACHRLLKKPNQTGPRKVIVRFVNRKFSEALLRSNKQFRNDDVQKRARLKDKKKPVGEDKKEFKKVIREVKIPELWRTY